MYARENNCGLSGNSFGPTVLIIIITIITIIIIGRSFYPSLCFLLKYLWWCSHFIIVQYTKPEIVHSY
jgi:hypothetical protein